MFSCFYFCYCVPIITYFHSPPRERIYEFGLPFSVVGVVSCLGHSRFADPLPQWALSSRDALRSSSVGVSVGVVSRKEPGRLSECWVPVPWTPWGQLRSFSGQVTGVTDGESGGGEAAEASGEAIEASCVMLHNLKFILSTRGSCSYSPTFAC